MRELELITVGEILEEEFLKPMGITQSLLAKEIDVPVGRISQIINNKREITIDTALRFAKFFGNTPQFWINLQVEYNLRAYEKIWQTIEANVHAFRQSHN